MFGLRIVTKKKLVEINDKARKEAIGDIVDLLNKKDKIYLEPVTIYAPEGGLKVTENVFFGSPTGLTMKLEDMPPPDTMEFKDGKRVA